MDRANPEVVSFRLIRDPAVASFVTGAFAHRSGPAPRAGCRVAGWRIPGAQAPGSMRSSVGEVVLDTIRLHSGDDAQRVFE